MLKHLSGELAVQKVLLAYAALAGRSPLRCPQVYERVVNASKRFRKLITESACSMITQFQSCRWIPRLGNTALLCLLAAGLSACALQGVQVEKKPAQQTSEDIVRLEQTVNQQKRHVMQLELQLVAKQSEIERLSSAKDQAVQELVRLKSKLRSRNSKAETVANLAEVKLALQAAQASGAKRHRDDGLKRAQQYVAMSEAALEEGNYDGASYLIGQAKFSLRTSIEPSGEDAEVDGKTSPFALPVQMTVTRKSNVRAGPGTDTEVLATLDSGASVSATGYRGLWVRIQRKKESIGWIHYSLLESNL